MTNSSVKLKALNTRLTDLNEQLRLAKDEQKEKSRQVHELQQKVNSLQAQIASFTKKKVVVSEHAILRYFERVLGFDLEEIKQKILNEQVQNSIDHLGNGKFPTGDGFRVVVRQRVITTIEV